MSLEEAAKRYAESKGATVLASRVDGNSIIFVLSTGPKLTMTREELGTDQEIEQPAAEVAVETPKKKGKAKHG